MDNTTSQVSKPLVYVAGAYRANSLWGILKNIHYAWKKAKELWALGFAVICPHSNTFWMSEPPNSLPADAFLDGDLAMVIHCDALFMLPNWNTSVGAIGERDYAREHNIPVFYAIEDLLDWKNRKQQTVPVKVTPEKPGLTWSQRDLYNSSCPFILSEPGNMKTTIGVKALSGVESLEQSCGTYGRSGEGKT